MSFNLDATISRTFGELVCFAMLPKLWRFIVFLFCVTLVSEQTILAYCTENKIILLFLSMMMYICLRWLSTPHTYIKNFRQQAVTSSILPLVIAGPSGVGKGTLVNLLTTRYPNLFGFSISHTTRKPRYWYCTFFFIENVQNFFFRFYLFWYILMFILLFPF